MIRLVLTHVDVQQTWIDHQPLSSLQPTRIRGPKRLVLEVVLESPETDEAYRELAGLVGTTFVPEAES